MSINTEKPLLTISLLASNRPDVIRRCLDSITPVMEQLPCELILVDTSQKPEIRRILEEYSKNIVEFTWCNDFAKARNAGLKKATGEWFLFIDDDEWFGDVTLLVQFFKSGEYKKYGCANYMVRNFYDQKYTNYVDCWASRMIRLEKDTEFRSKIHEYLYPVNGECKALPVVVNHSGYVYATKEEQQKHYERNASLLLQMMKEEPEVLRWKVQLVQEYHSMKDWNLIYNFCMDCLEQNKDTNNFEDNLDLGTFYSAAIESLTFLERYQDAIELGEKAKADPRSSELCQANMYLSQAVAYYRMDKLAQTIECIQHYFELQGVLLKTPNKFNNQRMALLVCETFELVAMKRAKSLLICCGLRQGNMEYLHQFFPDLEWEGKSMYLFDGIIDEMIQAAAHYPKDQVLVHALKQLWEHPELQTDIFAKFVGIDEQNHDDYKRILAVASDFEGEHWYPWYARILAADNTNNEALLQSGVDEFFQRVSNIFLTPKEVSEVMEKHGISLEYILLNMTFDKWANHLAQYISKAGIQDTLILAKELKQMKTCENIRYDYSEMRFAEAEVLYFQEGSNRIKEEELLYVFAKKTVEFAEKYYHEQALEEYADILPTYIQAGWKLWKALTTESTETEQIQRFLEEAELAYPDMAACIHDYRVHHTEIQIQKEIELKDLARLMKKQVFEFVQTSVKNHNYKDALKELEELKQRYPNDLEIASLCLEVRMAMLS